MIGVGTFPCALTTRTPASRHQTIITNDFFNGLLKAAFIVPLLWINRIAA
jgi:hypothetical protein